ncbi:MAG: hypothetical protein HYU80_04450 [Candidatus Blackburnbacteria bacterium]|nr:hypothetical protein [Candidatus Blackburnbacteria bacterium]
MSIDLEQELGKFREDSIPGKASLARAFSAVSEAWREQYGPLPTIGKVTPADSHKTVDDPLISPHEQIRTSLGLAPEQLAQQPDQITPDTKAYIGPLVHRDSKGEIIPIFSKLGSVDHVYRPDGTEIPRWRLPYGGKSVSQLESELDGAGVWVSPDAGYILRYMFRSKEFTTQAKPEVAELMMPTVEDMGFPEVTRWQMLFDQTKALGGVCSPEIGPYQRLYDREQKPNTWYYVVMEPIADSYGYPLVFRVIRDGVRRWLRGHWVYPDYRWDPTTPVVVTLGK